MNWSEFLANHSWDMLGMGMLLVASGFVSGTETALFNLSRGQLYHMRHSSHRLAHRVAILMRQPRRVLNSLLLINLVINTAYASIGALVTVDLQKSGHAPGYMLAVSTVSPLLLLIIFAEVIPKVVAYRLAPSWATAAAVVMEILVKGLSPLLWAMEKLLVGPLTRLFAPRRASRDISTDDLAAVLDLSTMRGIIAHDANVLLQEIVDLTQLSVDDIMVPRVDMIAYDINDPADGLVQLFRKSHLRKIPVYDAQPDQILGVIYGKNLLLNPNVPLRELVAKVPFVPESANIEKLLIQFRVTRKQMAIVVDEFGGVSGLVTLQDILEQIVGEIPDMADEQSNPPVQRQSDSRYIIDGNLSIHDWADAFRIDLSAGRIATLGGFVTSLLGRIPRDGDQARYRNLLFKVLSMRGRRIHKLQVELMEDKK